MAVRRRALVIVSAAALAGCSAAEVRIFPTLASAMAAIEGVARGHKATGAWTLPQVMHHLAQSVDGSIDGYPNLKPALFRAAIGGPAFAVFQARGRMSHPLAEPIPGAPALDATAPLEPAIARLLAALRRFEAHAGALAPHFAYGALDKAQYTRAHLMHLANHWDEVALT